MSLFWQRPLIPSHGAASVWTQSWWLIPPLVSCWGTSQGLPYPIPNAPDPRAPSLKGLEVDSLWAAQVLPKHPVTLCDQTGNGFPGWFESQRDLDPRWISLLFPAYLWAWVVFWRFRESSNNLSTWPWNVPGLGPLLSNPYPQGSTQSPPPTTLSWGWHSPVQPWGLPHGPGSAPAAQLFSHSPAICSQTITHRSSGIFLLPEPTLLSCLHPLCPPSRVPGWMFETWRCCITIIAASSFDCFSTNWQGKELLCLLKGRKDTIRLLYS